MDESIRETETIKSDALESADDVDLIELLNEQAWSIVKVDTKRALELATQSHHLAEIHLYDRGLAYSLRNSAYCNNLLGNNQVGLDEAVDALGIFEQLDDKHGIASVLTILINIYEALGKYSEAVECHSRGLRICELIDDKPGAARSFNNIGKVYCQLGDYAKALDCYRQSLGIKTEINDLGGLQSTLVNIGVVYEALEDYGEAAEYYLQAVERSRQSGDSYTENASLANLGLVQMLMGKHTSALSYLQKALEDSQTRGIKFHEAALFNYLGRLYHAMGEHEKAVESYGKGLRIAQDTGNKPVETEVFLGLGALFFGRREYGEAIHSISKGLRLAKSIGDNRQIFNAHYSLSQLYERQGNLAKALDHYKRFYAVRQVVLGEEADKNLKRVMIQAEVEKAEREKEIYRLSASRLEGRLAQAQLELLSMQLQPHFLFNTLNTIAELVHYDSDGADRMIACLSALLRVSLDNIRVQEVPLKDELAFLERYLDIEQVRFQDRLTVKIEVEPESLAAHIPSMILQPLVENAIRYGIAPRAIGGLVEIKAHRQSEMLHVQVRDDNPALMERDVASFKEGIGLSNTRARLFQLYGEHQSLDLVQSPNGGLTVELTIPFVDTPMEEEVENSYVDSRG
ncbi:MAG: tetratricopeptide repeat protein [Pyrinomonadaceae bacterium]